jgi:hypothetical protein
MRRWRVCVGTAGQGVRLAPRRSWIAWNPCSAARCDRRSPVPDRKGEGDEYTVPVTRPRLMTGYALDALAAHSRKDPPLAPRGALHVIDRVGQVSCQPCPSVGVGEDWRFEAEDLVGQALVAEGVCVHLSAFPNEDRDGRGAGRTEQQIVPPSRRRRSRRGRGG